MNKKILILMLSVLSNYYFSQQNNIYEGEAIYSAKFGNIKDNSDIVVGITDDISELIFSEKESKITVLFKDDKRLSIPVIKPSSNTKKDFNTSQIILEEKGIYYTDLSKNTVYNDKDFEGKHIIIGYNIPDLKWNITDETKTIQGQKVIKATANYKLEKDKGNLVIREVTAWFSENINSKIAPLHFYGLPGIVVSLEAEGMHYNLISIIPKKVNIDYNLNHKKIISEEEYLDLTNLID